MGTGSDGHGGRAVTRTVLLETYASVMQQTSTRNVEEMQQVLNGQYIFKVKYRSSFEPTKSMLINYDDTDFTIQRIVLTPERHRRQWVMTAVRADDSDVSVT